MTDTAAGAEMTIDGSTLTIDGTAIELPKLPTDSRVHAWSVPKAYRESGYFVTTQQPGQPREAPACAGRDARYLGALDYPADPITAALAQLPAVRWQRVAAGTQWNGWPVKTGPADIPLIHAVHSGALSGSRVDGSVFKFGDSVFRGLTNAQATAMAEKVFAWVQAHFDHEDALEQQLRGGELVDIQAGWPE